MRSSFCILGGNCKLAFLTSVAHSLSKDEGTSEKVDTIKRAVLDGTYKVDDKTIAKKIMDNINIQKLE